MACDPDQLVQAARCIQACIPTHMMDAASLAALCRYSAVTPPVGCQGTQCDVIYRMDGGVSGATPTVAQLNAATFGLANGTWSKVGADGTWILDNTGDAVIPGLKLADGSGCGDPIQQRINQNLGISFDRYPLFTFGSAKPVMCTGFAFMVETFTGEFDTYNIMRHDTGGGEYFICTIELNNNDIYVYAHASSSNGLFIGLPIVSGGLGGVIAQNTWYWVAMKRDASLNCRLQVYRVSDWVQQGSESVGLVGVSEPVQAVRCGLSDPTGAVTIGTRMFWDDIAFRFADVHPLLPIP